MSFENLSCPKCSSNIVEISGRIEDRVEIIDYTCRSCGHHRVSVQPKKSVRELRSLQAQVF